MAARLEDIPKEFFKLTQSANAEFKRESAAAVKIQSCFRGFVVATKFKEVLRAARLIQRLGRGYLGRMYNKQVKVMRVKAANLHFFHHCASIIQKFWRGFWSRRKLLDFYKRRSYLDEVVAKGSRTVECLHQKFKAELEKKHIEEAQALQDEFADLTSQVHHLVSTRSVAGIFNPIYAPALPVAFDKPLEQHLRENCRIGPIKSLRRPLDWSEVAAAKSARADFAGSGPDHTSSTYRPEQIYVMPPSQAPPSQRTPRAPKMVGSDGKVVLPMKSPRFPKDPEASRLSPKAPAKLPTLTGSPRKSPKVQSAR